MQYILPLLFLLHICHSANILMVTMGGSKSHKIPFWELARGLIPRGHNVTFISGYPADFHLPGLEEITPLGLVFYIRNYTNWDLLGVRMAGKKSHEVVPMMDVIRYAYESCDALLSDPETKDFLRSRPAFDLMIMDGAFPECTLGLSHQFNVPFMYLNTVGFYTGSLSLAGNPTPYSVTPVFLEALTDKMNLLQRAYNTGLHIFLNLMHKYTIEVKLDAILREHFGNSIQPAYVMARNVSFILQNAHATVTYPRPYLPNVAEVACIHCKPAKSLPKDLEDFINEGGDTGFIYVSMGSAVKASNMPERLRRLLLRVFEQLPYRVLWKWEAPMDDLPENVKTGRWLPQQDILGHKKLRAFVTHGGLLSMFETVYHGVPVISLPVFCDHESNAAKAEIDGYAIKLELSTLTSEILLTSIKKVIHDPKYRKEVKRLQILLRDQKETPLERAIYWTEYVLRHKGAKHLQSPAKDLNWMQYYLLDVVAIYLAAIFVLFYFAKVFMRILYHLLTKNVDDAVMYTAKSKLKVS